MTAVDVESPEMMLFAKLPERLSDEERMRRYDIPLAEMLERSIHGTFHRGFSPVGADGQIMWIGLEVRVREFRDCGFVARCLRQLGASPESVIELDTPEALVTLELAELVARG